MNEAPKVRVYEKPTCTTCKNLMMLLKDKGIDFDAVDYMIDPIPQDQLRVLVRKMGGTARDLIRTKEPEYKEMGLDKPGVSDDTIFDALFTHPQLVQRPIVEIGDKAIIARPAEKVNDIL